jgi:apolipoprotein N-acyltransferase
LTSPQVSRLPSAFPLSVAMVRKRVYALSGWRRRSAAVGAGAVSVLAMAPFFAFPVLWLTLPVLVWLIDAARLAPVPLLPAPSGALASLALRVRRSFAYRAAGIAWWFGFGYFLAGLFWIGEAFLVEAETFAVLLPFAVMAMPAGLALFWAAVAALAQPFWRPGWSRVLALALALSAMEYARGHVLSGFPWNVLGYALTYPLPLMQSAALFGIYGLTLIAVLVFTLPLVLWSEAPLGADGRASRRAALLIAALPLLAAGAFGQARLASGPAPLLPGVKIRIVQPSVPQREKWRPENQERFFLDHLKLSRTAPDGSADDLSGISHVLWSEAAMPFLPLDHPQVRSAIGDMLPPGVLLIAGALRAEPAPPAAPRPRRIYNSIIVFGEGGTLAALYDKIHLVPFGEYLPLQTALEAIGLQQLTRLRGGFDAGVKPRPLMRLAGLPAAAPLICYEVIFPRAIVQGGERPGVLLNVTNDGWFGNTTGPRQHFHQARVRAVEEGLPLLRAANNGISAAIDGHGRVLVSLGLDERGSLDTGLPRPLSPPPYARYGDSLFFAMWLIAGAALLSYGRWWSSPRR